MLWGFGVEGYWSGKVRVLTLSEKLEFINVLKALTYDKDAVYGTLFVLIKRPKK